MKLTYLTLFVLFTLGFVSCRKEGNDIDIKTYDEQQIKAYIAANRLTNMKQAPGDTSGIYYEILTPGKGAKFTYKDTISFVYTIKSVDGLYNVTDTIYNHGYSFAGKLTPPGLMLAVNTLLTTKGTRARLLIPSRLAYGVNGSGIGSSRLRGNQSLEYYIHIIDNQDEYDDVSIQNYMRANNFDPASFTKITSGRFKGMYFRLGTPGTGTTTINESSSVTAYCRGRLLNSVVFDPGNYSETNVASMRSFDLRLNDQPYGIGFNQSLLGQREGAAYTLFVPSRLAYGSFTSANFPIVPVYSCLHFEVNIGTVTNN